MGTRTKSRNAKRRSTPSSIVWFEIPADDPDRAKKFYSALFGWKINPFANAADRAGDYWHIDTGGADASPDGGMMRRMHLEQTITQYVSVPSVVRFMAKVEKFG